MYIVRYFIVHILRIILIVYILCITAPSGSFLAIPRPGCGWGADSLVLPLNGYAGAPVVRGPVSPDPGLYFPSGLNGDRAGRGRAAHPAARGAHGPSPAQLCAFPYCLTYNAPQNRRHPFSGRAGRRTRPLVQAEPRRGRLSSARITDKFTSVLPNQCQKSILPYFLHTRHTPTACFFHGGGSAWGMQEDIAFPRFPGTPEDCSSGPRINCSSLPP